MKNKKEEKWEWSWKNMENHETMIKNMTKERKFKPMRTWESLFMREKYKKVMDGKGFRGAFSDATNDLFGRCRKIMADDYTGNFAEYAADIAQLAGLLNLYLDYCETMAASEDDKEKRK